MEIIERLKTGIKTGLKLSPAECDSFYDEFANLQSEKAELVAQVDAFKSALNDASQPHNSGSSPDFVSGWNTAIKLFEDIYLSTPTKCLNQIKAEAGRAGYLKCKADFSEPHETWWVNGENHLELANQYAASIAKGDL